MKIRSFQVSVQPVVAVASVVVANPLAGRGRVDDLSELEALGAEAAGFFVERALAALNACGVSPEQVRGYGKGAIIGICG